MGRSLEHLRTAALLTAGAVAVGVLALAAASGDDSSAISPDTVDALAFDDRALAFTGAPDAVTVGRPAAEPTEASAVAQAATFDPGSPASPADPATDPAREGAPALPVNGPVDEGPTPTDAPATTAAISGATSSTSGTKPAPTSTTTARTSSTATPTTATPTTAPATTATPTTAPATTATPTTATPTTAPATSPLRVVMLEGESTSDPNGGWNTFPPGVAARLPDGTTLRVDGTNGYRIDNVLAEGSKASYLSAGTDVAVLWIGINDISQGRQPATVYAQMSQWVEARRNEGWERVIMVTVTKFEHPESVKSYSWGSHEVADQKRQELNSLIVANAAGADRVVDLRGVPGIGDAFSVHDTYWRADRVHFTGAGNEAVAEEVAAAILTLVR